MLGKQKEDYAKNLELSLEIVHVTKKIHCCKMRLLTFPVRGWKSCNDDSNPHVGQRMNPTSVSGQLQDRIN